MARTILIYSPHLVGGMLLSVLFLSSVFYTISGVGAEGLVCEEGERACRDGSRCYLESDHCNDHDDCDDGSDEQGCALSCLPGELACVPNGVCLDSSFRCDGVSDCDDNSDESNCEGKLEDFKCQFDSDFKCASERRCIVSLHRCDGTEHCNDGSDEKNCPSVGAEGGDGAAGGRCDPETQFDCKGDGSECIKKDYMCDTVSDCQAGQDESNNVCEDYVPKPGRPRRPADASSCALNNPCSQFCNLTDSGSIACSCRVGFHLAADQHTCYIDGEEPQLIYANHSQLFVYGLRSNDKSSVEINAAVHSIAYDHKGGKIFYIDSLRKTINSISKDLSGQPVTLIDQHVHEPVSLAYDWVHGTLYFADVSPHAGAAYTRIEAVTLKNMQRTTILTGATVKDPRQLVVDPRTGKRHLYWSQIGTSPSICRSGLDGSDYKVIVSSDIQQPSGLTLDYATDTLYWVDKHEGSIVSYNLLTNERRVVTNSIEYPRNPTSLDVFEDILYWVDDRTNILYKHKALNSDVHSLPQKVFENLESTRDAVVYHRQRLPEGENVCGSNNGGCSHICLPSSSASKPVTCLCPNVQAKNSTVTYVLKPDGKTCLEKKIVVTTTSAPSANKPHKPVGGAKGSGGQSEGQGNEEDKEEGGGGSMGIIIGAAVGAIVVLAIVAIVIWRVLVARNSRKAELRNGQPMEAKPLNKSAANGTNGTNGHAGQNHFV